MTRTTRASALLLIALAAPAFADPSERSLCPARPGLATPPCIVDSGHGLVEIGLADWTLDRQGGDRSDTILAGDLLLRLGMSARSELQVGLTSFGAVRSRTDGAVSRAHGLGDMTLAFKHSLRNPDGGGVSVAVQPFVTLPTGGSAIGADDWGAGLILPVGAPLGKGVALELTPEIDAAVDADGTGRHVALSAVEGLSFSLTPSLSTSVELQEVHDADPAGRQDHVLAGLSLAWQPSAHWQLDLGSVAGLDRASPDIELYVGISRRF
ncbi:MAG: transporter [Sphingobium sp.]|nr:transporter [Sphingobium sp.]